MSAGADISIREQTQLRAAQGGDRDAFRALVEPLRAELNAHCYRMLGSVPDAEEAVQEALLRAWRGMPRFEARSSLRSWLHRIAANVSLSAIERRPRRLLPIDQGPASEPGEGPGEPLVESVWLEPFADENLEAITEPTSPEASYELRESVELAFVAALQHLPPRQRAVLILREVLGFSGAEVAVALDSTPASVYSALQRAHRTVEDRLPERSQQATLRELGDKRLRGLVEEYVEAWERGDVEAILELLTDEATIAMPPHPTWFRGRESVGRFLSEWPLASGRPWRLIPTRANGQVAFGTYLLDADRGVFVGHAIDVLSFAGGRVEAIDAFVDPRHLVAFGLPAEIRP
jgi:RNA polymerase sigma-70 factor (ECF subfamily)